MKLKSNFDTKPHQKFGQNDLVPRLALHYPDVRVEYAALKAFDTHELDHDF